MKSNSNSGSVFTITSVHLIRSKGIYFSKILYFDSRILQEYAQRMLLWNTQNGQNYEANNNYNNYKNKL